jgi:hypothetical protein
MVGTGLTSLALPDWLAGVVVGVSMIVAALFYFLPFIIGETRGVPHIGSIFAVNLVFGWSVIGWVVALVMALRSLDGPAMLFTPMPVDQAAAGWYPDPETGRSRWWDGTRWGPIRTSD